MAPHAGRERPCQEGAPIEIDLRWPDARDFQGHGVLPAVTIRYSRAMRYVFAPPPHTAVRIVGSTGWFPVHRIYGYAVGLDMTRRDLQSEAKKQGRPWCIAKAFERSAPVGGITPAAWVEDVSKIEITLDVNGVRRQHGRVADLIWKIPEIIAHLSAAWDLKPGDLIFTGTPAGVGAVGLSDLMTANATDLAELRVRVMRA